MSVQEICWQRELFPPPRAHSKVVFIASRCPLVVIDFLVIGEQGLPFVTARQSSVVYCDVTEQNRVAMSRHRHNVASRHYDGSRRCCYSGVN
jgi:hypothetical protein